MGNKQQKRQEAFRSEQKTVNQLTYLRQKLYPNVDERKSCSVPRQRNQPLNNVFQIDSRQKFNMQEDNCDLTQEQNYLNSEHEVTFDNRKNSMISQKQPKSTSVLDLSSPNQSSKNLCLSHQSRESNQLQQSDIAQRQVDKNIVADLNQQKIKVKLASSKLHSKLQESAPYQQSLDQGIHKKSMANVISFVDSSLSPDNTFTSKRHNSVNATSVVKKQFHPQHFRKVTNNNLSHYAQEAYDQVDSTFLYDPFYSSPLPKKKIKNTFDKKRNLKKPASNTQFKRRQNQIEEYGTQNMDLMNGKFSVNQHQKIFRRNHDSKPTISQNSSTVQIQQVQKQIKPTKLKLETHQKVSMRAQSTLLEKKSSTFQLLAKNSKQNSPNTSIKNSKLQACNTLYGKLISTIEKTGKKSHLLKSDELHLTSIYDQNKKEQQKKIDQQKNENDPKKQMIGNMLKSFFQDREEELKMQQERRLREIQIQERHQQIKEIMNTNNHRNSNQTLKSSLRRNSIKRETLNGDKHIVIQASSLDRIHLQPKNDDRHPTFMEEETNADQKSQPKLQRRKTVIIQPQQLPQMLTKNDSPANAKQQNRGKKAVIAYKNSKMSGQQSFLNWLVAKIPEKTRLSVQRIYTDFFDTKDEEVLASTVKNKPEGVVSKDIQAERFYRLITDEKDQNPVIGNARMQTSYNGKLADEEFDFMHSFKITRQCRQSSHTPGSGQLSNDIVKVAEQKDNLFLTQPKSLSPVGQTKQISFTFDLVDEKEVSKNDSFQDLEPISSEQNLSLAPSKTMVYTQAPKDVQKLSQHTNMRENFNSLLRMKTQSPVSMEAQNQKDMNQQLYVFTKDQIQELFRRRCADLKIQVKSWQLKRFESKVNEMSFNRKLNLTNMMIGPLTAQLLSFWILSGQIDVTHLLLGQNNLGDEGVHNLAEAIALNKSIVAVDLSQNGLTPKAARAIRHIIGLNESIYQLNLNSIKGANRNRLGRDGGMSVAQGFIFNRSLIQYLSLRSTTIGNDEVEALADSLEYNLFIIHLDLSENRLEGVRAGVALARIIQRDQKQNHGENLKDLILAHNKLKSAGFQCITNAVTAKHILLDQLDVSYNEIDMVRVPRCLNEYNRDIHFGVQRFCFDGNELGWEIANRLCNIIKMARKLNSVSLRKCLIEDEGLICLFKQTCQLSRLKKIDVSDNGITEKGLDGICQYIGLNTKTTLKAINFSHNLITTPGIVKLFDRIQKNTNYLKSLNFSANSLDDDTAQFVSRWLKEMRMLDLEHNMNIVECDLSQNKIIFRYLKEVESDLQVNAKFKQEAKNRKIQHELHVKKLARSEHKRIRKQQKLFIQKQKDIDEACRFKNDEFERAKEGNEHRLVNSQRRLKQVQEMQSKLDGHMQVDSLKIRSASKKEEEANHRAKMEDFQIKIEEVNKAIQQLEGENKEVVFKIQELSQLPLEQRKMSQIPHLMKEQLQEETNLENALAQLKDLEKQISELTGQDDH